MKVFYPVYIRPENGQSVYELAKEIAVEKASGKIGDKIFVSLPNGNDIEIKGETEDDIRDSIARQYKYTKF